MTKLSRLSAVAVAATCPAIAFAESGSDFPAFGASALVAVVGLAFCLTAALVQAYFFRLIARKFADIPAEFGLAKATAFFAIVPLLFTVVIGIVAAMAAHLEGDSPQGGAAAFAGVASTLASGLAISWLARKWLLKLDGTTLPYLKAVGITVGAYVATMVASWIPMFLLTMAFAFLTKH